MPDSSSFTHRQNSQLLLGRHGSLLASPDLSIKSRKRHSSSISSASSSTMAAVTTGCKKFFATPKKKRVQFDNFTYCQSYLHINEYTADERYACWYTKSDYNRMKKYDLRPMVKMYKARIAINDPDKYTYRGLETLTSTGAASRRARREAAWCAVWKEQDRQSSSGRRCHHYLFVNTNIERLAKAYGKQTEMSLLAAQARGWKDQDEVYITLY